QARTVWTGNAVLFVPSGFHVFAFAHETLLVVDTSPLRGWRRRASVVRHRSPWHDHAPTFAISSRQSRTLSRGRRGQGSPTDRPRVRRRRQLRVFVWFSCVY